MAARFPTPTVKDLCTTISPLQLSLNGGKLYKFLVKPEIIKFISEHSELVQQQLSNKIPAEPPETPIYFDIVQNEVVLPEVIYSAGDGPSTSKKHPEENTATRDTVTVGGDTDTAAEDITEEPYTPPLGLTDPDEDGEDIRRFEWRFSTTKHLLSILSEKKQESTKDFVLTKKLWTDVSKGMAKLMGTMTNAPKAQQCREKFYSLKRAYRKYLGECKKTGNKRLRPFLFETDMDLLLHDDPAFKPNVVKSSFGKTEINNNREEDDEDEEDGIEDSSSASTCTSKSRQPTKKKSKTDDLKHYLEERDTKFLKVLGDMQETQNKLLEKLIEKM